LTIFDDPSAVLEEWQRFILAEIHILQEDPDLLFQQAINQPDSALVVQTTKTRLAKSLEKRPFVSLLSRAGCLCIINKINL
jgi:hypothetical protein